jgi:hypothetical protein
MGVTFTGSIFPTQRAAILYSGNQFSSGFKAKNALVIAGRTEYGQAQMQEAAMQGAIVLLYINVSAYANIGPFHNMYFNSGTLGGTSYGAIGTFNRGGTDWQGVDIYTSVNYANKFDYCIRALRATYPWARGFFFDDGGPSWAGYNNPVALYGQTYGGQSLCTLADKNQAYTYHLALAQKMRAVCDEFGWMVINNAEWRASDDRGGSGYPVKTQHGISLYDGQCQEHHSFGEGSYWPGIMSGSQHRARDRDGQHVGFVISDDSTETSGWVNKSGVAWIAEQHTYDGVPPAILSTHDMGFIGGTGTPTVTVTVTPTSLTIQTGTQQQFSGSASNSATLTWAVNGITGGNSTIGTITQSGLYTAPVAVPSGGVVSVSASISTGESDTSPVTIIQGTPPPTDETLPDPPAASFFWGNRFSGTVTNVMTPDFVRGVLVITPNEPGTVTKFWVGVSGLAAGTASQPFTPRMYQVDSNANPTSLLCSGAELTIVNGQAPGWVSSTVASGTATFTAATQYLLAIHSGGTEGTGYFYRMETDGVSRSIADVYSDGGISSMTGAGVGDADISIFVEYTPTGSSGAAIAGSSQGGSSSQGNLTSSAIAVPLVAYFQEPVVVTKTIAVPYQINPDGSKGQRVVWNQTSQQFEPAS